ncbi:MAG: Cu(I)/Ag(I) efflux system membrane fusion protein [Myxococcota bacterium]|jgi:Cu(I)/Ag(I) efflux system membrane fusion protein
MTDPTGSVLTRAPALMVRVAALGLAFALGWFFAPSGHTDVHPVTEAGSPATVWTCAMHPQIRASEPGTCPICGMDLITATTSDHAASPNQVVLSERARALARLQTTVVRRQGDASAQMRLLGRIEPDETTRKNVTTWVGGRIDRLHVNTTGERVRAGQVVATLYSPEVYGAHQDLLTAKTQVASLVGATEGTRAAAQSALRAARERLRLLGVPEREVVEMEAAERPAQALPIRTPFSGTVIERVATEGAYVLTGATLYRVADLDRLWVQLDAYESDLSRIAVGQAVSITVEGQGGTVDGTVAFIDPTLDPVRRTARIRVAVSNPDGQLRPGMFVEAVVSSAGVEGPGASLVIPASAPLFTGRRSIVYVELADDGRLAYEPRTVRLGPRMGELYPVVAGLSAGERVVSRGAFAIDADLQIRGGASMMMANDDRDAGVWDAVVELPPAERATLAPVVQRYLDVQRALAEDDHQAAARAADGLVEAAGAVALSGEASTAWAELADPLGSHARHVARSADIEGARAGFEPLSAAVQALLRRFGNPLDTELHVAFCPMAQGSAGAEWVQAGTTIDNAYFGAAMRSCGEIRGEVSPGAFLPSDVGAPPVARPPTHDGHVH